ncbi:MAG: DUF1049 domain-containing protein [candidate division Zixibacteria bacterium]|nr:DUF1049 domain-containing protein [candidate division Zixibacteria bacterium]
MIILRAFLILVVLAIIIGFSVYNAGPRVDVDLIRAQYNVPLVVVVYWSFLAGMLVAFLLAISYILKMQSDRRSERLARKRLEMEISALRNRTIEKLDQL